MSVNGYVGNHPRPPRNSCSISTFPPFSQTRAPNQHDPRHRTPQNIELQRINECNNVLSTTNANPASPLLHPLWPHTHHPPSPHHNPVHHLHPLDKPATAPFRRRSTRSPTTRSSPYNSIVLCGVWGTGAGFFC